MRRPQLLNVMVQKYAPKWYVLFKSAHDLELAHDVGPAHDVSPTYMQGFPGIFCYILGVKNRDLVSFKCGGKGIKFLRLLVQH